MSTTHLAVDLGASSGRVIAGKIANDRLTLTTVHRFANTPVTAGGSLQWNVLGLWAEIQRGLRSAATEHGQPTSIGVDSWGVDYALLDDCGQLAGPVYHYRDGRTDGVMDRVVNDLGRQRIFDATGLQFMPINTIFQLAAAASSGDGSLRSAKSFVMIAELFHYWLTGRATVELTNASTTQLLDPRTGAWRTDLLEAIGVSPSLFADPIAAGGAIGPITSIDELAGVPVITPATHDTGSAVIAVPAEGFAPRRPDWCYISSGTWSLMGVELPSPLINDTCAELNFTNEGGVLGSTRLLKNIGGLWVFQQIRAALARRGDPPSWRDMVTRSAAAKPFGLVLDPDAPSLLAPDDMIAAIEQFADRTGQPSPADDATIFRAALEGLALRYRACLAMLERLTATTLSTIHIVGGGSQNELLCQMTADACDRTVVAGPVEATAAGNVIMQAIGSGGLAGVEEGRQLIRSSFTPTLYEPNPQADWDAAAAKFGEVSRIEAS